MHHIVKDHVFVVCPVREKKLSTCHLYVNMYFVTLHNFVILQIKGTKFIATILANYNLQIAIANYNCGPYQRLPLKDSDRSSLWRTVLVA